MMRILFFIFLFIIAGYFVLQGIFNENKTDIPVFLKIDTIAGKHRTEIDVVLHASYSPDSFQLEALCKDYSSIWAHLNHLFQTNDVEAGKEYYTEAWFRQLNRHYEGIKLTGVRRQDISHKLYIENWSSDALVCTAIDSNAVFLYHFPGLPAITDTLNLAVVLLYQGDHWRIDALQVIGKDIKTPEYDPDFGKIPK